MMRLSSFNRWIRFALYAVLLCCICSGAQARLTGKLAYIDGGTLWLKTLPAGTPKAMLHGIIGNHMAWSPSGRWLLVGNHVFDCAGLSAHRISVPGIDTAERVVWSPVGDVLAYEYHGGLSIVRPGDKQAQVLRTPVSPVVVGSERIYGGVQDDFLWSPDGKHLAYVDRQLVNITTTEERRMLFDEQSSVWSIDRIGKAPRRLLDISLQDDYRALLAQWSSDGTNILFHQQLGRAASGMRYGRPLVMLPAIGGKLRVLTKNTPPSPDAFSLSPDHRRVVFAENDGPFASATWRLAVLTLRTGDQFFLTDMKTVAVDPVWSPTAQQIAYLRTNATSIDYEQIFYDPEKLPGVHLWLVTLGNTSRHRTLTTDQRYREEAPQWSRDGKTLIFSRIDKQQHASLWAMNSDGTGLHTVAPRIGPSGKNDEYHFPNESKWYYAWWQH